MMAAGTTPLENDVNRLENGDIVPYPVFLVLENGQLRTGEEG